MADTKISALTAASALDGTETVPIVQGGATVKATVADIRASFTVVGTGASPETEAGTARPSTSGPVYWMMANGVTPTNAADGDIIWNADA